MKELPSFLGHRRRLKERFLNAGFSSFHDYEVLELLLFFVIPRKDCKPIAKELIKKFGNFSSVLQASRGELEEIGGIGAHAAFFLSILRDAASYYSADRAAKNEVLDSSRKAKEYFGLSLKHLEREVFTAVFLSSENEILGSKALFLGTVDQSAVYPREVIAEALKSKSNRVIVAHNHIGRSAEPSGSDRELTRALVCSLGLVDIRLFDHVIVSSEASYSFAENGFIEECENEFRKFQGSLKP